MKLVFLGPPGAGKGTLAALAKDALGVVHISTGDIFRANIKNGTPLGLKVKAILDSGGLVPDETTIEIVKDRLAQADCKAGYLLDGFPRTVAQAEALAGFENLDAVINFDLADTEIVKRLSGRRVCKACGTGFHLTAMPPKKSGVCDKCGGELIQRKDDEPASIEERLRVYTANTQPLIDWYAKKGLLKNIDAAPAPEEILKALKKVLK
ncbi:MAG TPA: adenylate kinase [Spirochaetia bacterium]|nr:adenylate kinase [Spirochaetia bacterium]